MSWEKFDERMVEQTWNQRDAYVKKVVRYSVACLDEIVPHYEYGRRLQYKELLPTLDHLNACGLPLHLAVGGTFSLNRIPMTELLGTSKKCWRMLEHFDVTASEEGVDPEDRPFVLVFRVAGVDFASLVRLSHYANMGSGTLDNYVEMRCGGHSYILTSLKSLWTLSMTSCGD